MLAPEVALEVPGGHVSLGAVRTDIRVASLMLFLVVVHAHTALSEVSTLIALEGDAAAAHV